MLFRSDALANANLLNHKVEVTGGVLEGECSAVLTSFFTEMRAREKAEKEKKKAKAQEKAARKGRLPKTEKYE